MAKRRKRYDVTMARVAGNIASGLVNNPRYVAGHYEPKKLRDEAVDLAQRIVKRIRDLTQ